MLNSLPEAGAKEELITEREPVRHAPNDFSRKGKIQNLFAAQDGVWRWLTQRVSNRLE
jgi:hypothetical protein